VASTVSRELLTVAKAAELARISERTIWRWLNDGLPRLQPAGRQGATRIYADDLRAFLERDENERLSAKVRAAAMTRPRAAA
jgi:excisionase family DNA binding protein